MNTDNKINFLKEKLDEIPKITSSELFQDQKNHKKSWKEDTENLLFEVFGQVNNFSKKFIDIRGKAESQRNSPKLRNLFFNEFEEYVIILNSAIKSLERESVLKPNPSPAQINKSQLSSKASILIQNINNNTNTLQNTISLDIKISFKQIYQICNTLPEKSEEAKKIVTELEEEVKKEKPRLRVLNQLLKGAFKISKDVGLVLLPYVIEHWDKISTMF